MFEVNKLNLPSPFLEKMKALLKSEYDEFLQSYEEEKSNGLRVNTLKISKEEFQKISPFQIEEIPWVETGFFYDNSRPGKHPFHEAGLYYIQEPSAMAVGEFVNPKPGEKVLDLCAAPGGKTTHLASKMNGEGLLVSNEIHPQRAKILSQNVERMGIKNTIVTNESSDRLAARFPSFFDRILVDAPCSGEGMFRKDEVARNEWSLDNVALCHKRQLDILENAASMLKVGGRLVYSTCTFAPEENEGTISEFLKAHPNFEIENVEKFEGFSDGRRDWVEDAPKDIDKTIRLWPHKIKGEGHYIAVLRKIDGEEENVRIISPKVDATILKHYKQFAKENLNVEFTGNFVSFHDQLYVLPEGVPSLDKLKVVRPGLHLGTFKKNRFEPSHSLALALRGDEAKRCWNVTSDSDDIYAYLKGEVIKASGEKGWHVIKVDGFSIGWGKLVGNSMKNHYPKGLRWT